MLCLKLVIAVFALFHHVTAQTVTLSNSEGTNLDERSTPYQICVDLSAAPSGSDLSVSITSSGAATSPEDFQLSNNILIFTDGTSELQQCINLVVVDDNLVEQDEFFSLTATASSGATNSQFFIISNDDNALIGLDQESYTVNEADGSVTVCVVFLMNSGIQDSILNGDATLSAGGGNATAVDDYGQPIPSSITLTSATPASGVCSTINIPQDATEEGREIFSVTVTAGARAQVVDGRGTAQVLIVDSCGPLPQPENGDVDAPITTVGSVATYSCNSGYLISGDSQRNCQMDGFWSRSAPTCLAICEALTNPEDGEVSINNASRVEGSTATYTCNAGFLLSGNSERVCQDDGMWSGAIPTCSAICEALTNPEDGEVSINDASRVEGSIATYTCNTGFLLSGNSERICQDNGMWSGAVPTCSVATSAICEDLTNPEGGQVSINDASRVEGSTATYTCNAGFLLSGNSERVCQDNGMWSGAVPTCSVATSAICEDLTNPEGGQVSINDASRVEGSTATYTCNAGFLLSGNSERVCQDNGMWSGAVPTCSQSPTVGSLSGDRNRNIGIGVGVGVGGFLLILLVVIVIAVLIVALRKKNTEKYVLNYSTVYGSGVGSKGNDYSSVPSNKPDGGESASSDSSGVNERGVDIGEDEGDEETNTMTFKEE